MLEVGEEEPSGVIKTMHRHGDQLHGRQCGGSLGRRCVGTVKMTVC
jgi:hypothetical protein